MRNVSVVIPSKGRPERLLRAVESVLSTAPGVQVVCVLEPDDKASWAILDGLRIDIVAAIFPRGHKRTTADLWNLGARYAWDSEYYVVSADDVIFYPGWLEASMEAMQALGGSGVVGFNEGEASAFGTLATHFMVSRKYAARGLGGTIMIPSYDHYWTDVEVTARARRDGRLAFAQRAMIDHEHPHYMTAEMDAGYERAGETRVADSELFIKRQEAGFPDDFEPVISYNEDMGTGWGTVAIGLRSYKSISSQFLAGWTAFVMAGLRRGDKLLDMRQTFGEPHHVAANKVVAEFLKTDCDSLLFVDDDMVIPHDALSKIRDSEVNWDYHIAMGFCTFKSTPPHAVAYVLNDTQPDISNPAHLAGEVYNALAHLPDNDATRVDAVGLAFTLIRREVFESMIGDFGPEWTSWFDMGLHSEMEDMRFSRKCREAGFGMCVDTSAKLGHIGEHVYGWPEHQKFIQLLEI